MFDSHSAGFVAGFGNCELSRVQSEVPLTRPPNARQIPQTKMQHNNNCLLLCDLFAHVCDVGVRVLYLVCVRVCVLHYFIHTYIYMCVVCVCVLCCDCSRYRTCVPQMLQGQRQVQWLFGQPSRQRPFLAACVVQYVHWHLYRTSLLVANPHSIALGLVGLHWGWLVWYQTGIRYIKRRAACISWGDPHYVTFGIYTNPQRQSPIMMTCMTSAWCVTNRKFRLQLPK